MVLVTWSLVPPGAKEPPPYPLNNARSDKLATWPWKAVQRQRCLVPASGFWEPEKAAREKGVAPWSYYSMKDERPFFMAGLWAEAHDPATGEVADTYTVIITDANAAMRVHDRMPVILATDAARRWIEPGRCRPSCWCPTRRRRCRLGASATPRRTAGSSRMPGWRSRWRMSSSAVSRRRNQPTIPSEAEGSVSARQCGCYLLKLSIVAQRAVMKAFLPAAPLIRQ